MIDNPVRRSVNPVLIKITKKYYTSIYLRASEELYRIYVRQIKCFCFSLPVLTFDITNVDTFTVSV